MDQHFVQMQQGIETWKKMMEDALAEQTRLMKESVAYAAKLSEQWRALAQAQQPKA